MTYEMKIAEERKDARKEGRIEGILRSVRALMQRRGWGIDEVMDALDVTPEDRAAIASML